MLKKGELGQFPDLRGALGKKERGGVFEGEGGIPRCTLWSCSSDPYKTRSFLKEHAEVFQMDINKLR